MPLPVYTRTSYGPRRMEHIAQLAYFRLYSPECVEGNFSELLRLCKSYS
jgi:hypothetical protein